MAPNFVIVDTESSVCTHTNVRVLVSLAYEVVTVVAGHVTVREAHYDVVAPPANASLDAISERVHGITPEAARRSGRALRKVLDDFLRAVNTHDCIAIVAHDVVGDATLLVSEAIRSGLDPSACRALRRLLCTKLLGAARCRIPMPRHPCDELMRQLNGAAPDDTPAVKWPSLAECCAILPRCKVVSHYPPHDARGDVERCRLVFGQMLR